jgi:hypothetical protein
MKRGMSAIGTLMSNCSAGPCERFRLSLVGGNGGIDGQFLLERIGERSFHPFLRARAAGTGIEIDLDQRIPGRQPLDRLARTGNDREDEAERVRRDHFEPFDDRTELFLHVAQQRERLRRRLEADPCDRAIGNGER